MSIAKYIIANMVSSLMDTKDDVGASLDKLDVFDQEIIKVKEFITKQAKFYNDRAINDRK